MAYNAAPEALLQLLLANPFARSPSELREGARELAQFSFDDAERWSASRSVAAGVTQAGQARRGVLALLHARALLGMPLHPQTGQRSVKRNVSSHQREARIAAASARCFARLSQLAGTSRALTQVRRDTWAACFGPSLVHGLLLEELIRHHDVLVSGETGSGKEEIARAIAEAVPGDGEGGLAPIAEINAAAVPDTLVESELFGHAKGAFTGANEARKGLVRSADRGCLFLDEVGDLPPSAQAKLLRVIETDRVQPLGTDQVHAVNVRFVAATHHDLRQRVREGAFRADLYQRLAGVVIHVAPLRERPEDIAPIGEHFLASAVGNARELLDTAAISRWLRSAEARNHPWPGNARELRNVVGNLLLGLPAGLSADSKMSAPSSSLPERLKHAELTLAEMERWYVQHVVEQTGGNLAESARRLGVDRSTVARKMRAP